MAIWTYSGSGDASVNDNINISAEPARTTKAGKDAAPSVQMSFGPGMGEGRITMSLTPDEADVLSRRFGQAARDARELFPDA